MNLYLRKEKQDLFIKTSIWNSFIEVFKKEKDIDVSSFLISVQIRGETILLKTNNPLINSEALILNSKISLKFETKLKWFWIDWKKFEIKYI